MTAAVFEPVRAARRAWELTAPQLTLEVDDLTSLPGATTPPGRPRLTAADGLPAATPNTNGLARTTCPGSASEATGGTS